MTHRNHKGESLTVIGIDLGATKLAGCLLDPRGGIACPTRVQLRSRQGAEIGELIVPQIARLLDSARVKRVRVGAVGICVPGIARTRAGRVWAPNIPGWEDYPLREEVCASLKDRDIRVVVASDREACILGEAWCGAARGCRDAIFLAVGTGIGAGILANGRVLRGAQDIAGAIGWLAFDRPVNPAYARCGNFEYYASGSGLATMATRLVSQTPSYRGRLKRKSGLTASDVFAACAGGDAVARRVLNDAIVYWGMACANLVSLFNPEKIVFGGGVFGPATQFLGEIKAEAMNWAQPIAIRGVSFEPSRLGNDAALLGAGRLAWQAVRR